jgi:hypothetical protein
MANDNSVTLQDPSGQLVSLPAEQAASAQDIGYTQPTQAALQAHAEKEMYGDGILNPIKAGAAAAARSASFGASDEILTDTGLVQPETLAGLQNNNTTADKIGEATGIIAPMLLGDELGPLNLVKGVSKLGTAAEHGVAALLPEGTSLASRILQKAGSKAVGSAVEGAAYGLGNVVSEHALGDPNLTAEHALGQIGLSALLGGGLGATFGLGEAVIPPAVSAAKQVIADTTEKIGAYMQDGFAKASSVVSGVPEEAIQAAIDNRGKVAMTVEQKSARASGLADTIKQQYDSTEAALKAANTELRPAETAELVKDVNPDVAATEYNRIFNSVGDTIAEIRAKPDIYPSRFAAKLEEIQKGLVRDGQSAQRPAEIFDAINDLKQTLDKKVLKFDGIASAADSDAIGLIKDLRGTIKESLQNEAVFGEGGARQAEFNEAQNEYLTAKKEFQKNFLYKSRSNTGSIIYKANPTKANTFLNGLGDVKNELREQALKRYTEASKNLVDQIQESAERAPSGKFDQDAAHRLIDKTGESIASAQKQQELEKLIGSTNTGAQGTNPLVAGGLAHALGLPGAVVGTATGVYNALKNPGGTIQRLAALETLVKKSTAKLEAGVQAVISGSSRAFSIGRGEVSAGIAKDFGKDHDESVATYNKRIEQIQHMAGNSGVLSDKLHDATADLQGHAPNVTQSMQGAAVRGVAFLNSKIPQRPKQGPLGDDWIPTKQEISTFNRYFNAVQSPSNVLKQAAAGTLTKEGVEAVKTVFPNYYEQINSTVMDKLSSKKGAVIPYRQKMMLSLLTGTPMTGSLLPKNVQANQAVFATMNAKAANDGAVKPSQAGLSKINLAQGLLTPGQASSRRIR